MPILATGIRAPQQPGDGRYLVSRLMEWAGREAAARPVWGRIGASNVGRCVRQLWYGTHPEAAGTPEPLQARSLLVFDLGDRIEDALCSMIQRAGIGFIRTDEKRDTVYLEGVGRVRADGFIETPEHGVIPVEMKSMSDWAFQRLAERGEVDEGYLCQGECYARAYGAQGTLFVGYRKETSALAEVYVPRNDARWAHVLEQARIAQGPTLPARPYTLDSVCDGCNGTGKTAVRQQPHKACGGTGRKTPRLPSFPCGYCSHKAQCWSDAGTVEMSTEDGRPVWHVLPAPETVRG